MPVRLQASRKMAGGKESAQSAREAWQAPRPPPVRARMPDEAGPQVEYFPKRNGYLRAKPRISFLL